MEATATRKQGSFGRFWKNASFRLKFGMIGLTIVVACALIVPLLYPGDPTTHYQVTAKLGPCVEHPLGTTSLGQDVLALLGYALRNSLMIGVIVATIGAIVGVMWGMIAGFVGGGVERGMMLIADTFIVMPSLPVMILVTSMMQGAATLLQLALILSLFAWANPARSIRSMVLSIRERDFIHTARFSRENLFTITTTEILPYLMSWVLSNFMNAILVAIASESGLALLGLSSGNMVTLGNMIQWARNRSAIMMGYWHWIVPPIVATVVLFVTLFMTITGYNEYKAMERGK